MLLSAEQERALDKVRDWHQASRVSCRRSVPFKLFGPAGSGKSTLAKYFAEGCAGKVQYACFTGKAAYVLQQKGCPKARTVHSLIYRPEPKSTAHILELEKELGLLNQLLVPTDRELRREKNLKEQIREEKEDLKDLHFTLNEDSELNNTNLLILDECSMIGQKMGEDLLSFGCPILVLGDPYQLPPVKGTGFFTKDKPDVLLEEIHRQAKESGILRMATDLRQGKMTDDYGDDVRIMGPEKFKEVIRPGILPTQQVIVGLNKTRKKANKVLREQQDRLCTSIFPRERDRVICLRNNHDKGLLNGTQFWVSRESWLRRDGTIGMALENEDTTIEVKCHREIFEGKEVPYQYADQAEHFDFSNAITCHKAQGSEWADVVVIDEAVKLAGVCPPRKWRYTAATRAAKTLVWVK